MIPRPNEHSDYRRLDREIEEASIEFETELALHVLELQEELALAGLRLRNVSCHPPAGLVLQGLAAAYRRFEREATTVFRRFEERATDAFQVFEAGALDSEAVRIYDQLSRYLTQVYDRLRRHLADVHGMVCGELGAVLQAA